MTISLVQLFGVALTIGFRITGMTLFAPFLGSTAIPFRIKAVLVPALTFLLYPMASTSMPQIAISHWPFIAFSELVIGIAIGITTNIVFDGVQMAGQVLSVQMGYSLVNILDPQTQVESTIVATFHQMITLLIFLRLNVHIWILSALAKSFLYLPPGAGNFRGAFVSEALHAVAGVFVIGIQVAAPVLSATLLADIALGILGKASPQLPLMLLGPALKSVLGLLILISALKYWPGIYEKMLVNSLGQTEHLLHLAR